MVKKFLKAFLAFAIVIAVGGYLFWPAEWSVRGPIIDFMTGKQIGAPAVGTLQSRFKLPDGFQIGVFAAGVNNARMMRITDTGDIIVSSLRPGEVILLHRDGNGDGVSDGRTVLLSGLDQPHGLAIKDGYLYVAETGAIFRVPFDADARIVGTRETVFDGLPPGGNHRTRTIGFGPDGMLYVTIGSSCNVCTEEHPYRAAMLRMRPDGTDAQIFATGLRNTVGFDWQPGTGWLYGTDNGRDLLGDDIPHGEINLIEEGQFYGWPYTYDDNTIDPDFGAGHETEIEASRVMAHGLTAHVAPLGMRFLKAENAPPGYAGAALVALHGSWNRSVLSGYKVVALSFADDGTISEEDFLTGFELNEDVIGRPVDIEQGPDGAIYVSDDYAGAVYRIGWGDMAVTQGSAISGAPQMADPIYSADDVAAGSALYAANGCAACHDPSSAPDGVQVKLLQSLKARYGVESLKALLDVPPGPMPRPDITNEERRLLSVYLLSLD